MSTAVEARSGLSGRHSPTAPTAPATFVYMKGGGDTAWRCEMPAQALSAKLCGVAEQDAARAFTQPNWDTRSRTAFPWKIDVLYADGTREQVGSKKAWNRLFKSKKRYVALNAVFPTVEGAVVWTRPDPPRASLMLQMQEQGIRTLAETDDNYFADRSQNLFLRQNRFAEREQMSHAKAMGMADALVFSTAALRDIYIRELRSRLGRKNVPEAFVCRNSVPRSMWPDRIETDGPLRVGFMGSSSHVSDVHIAYPAFCAAKALGCETLMIGYSPGDPDTHVSDFADDNTLWRSDKSLIQRSIWRKAIDRHIGWITPAEYHRAALPLDIGLAPLRFDGFTAGKSDAKAIEYTISGAACVLQNVPLYSSAGWVHERNCLLVGSATEMAAATERLVRDAKLRYELVSAAQEMVMNERNEETLRAEWGYAIAG